MALIVTGKTECPLCNEVLQEGDRIVATTHFIGDPRDPLWPFSDGAMHKSCFLEWDHRKVFVERYNATMGSITWGNGTYHYMNYEGEVVSLKRENEEEN